MNAFLLDLWADLRAKRMWPVAALLVIGLVAVPVVLSKPADEPAPAPAPVQAETSEDSDAVKGLAALTVAKTEAGEGSTLDVFDPANPFKPPQKVLAGSADADAAADTGQGSGADAGGGATDGGTTTDGGTGTGTGGGTGTGDGGSGGTGGTSEVAYRFVVDVTFIQEGKKRKIKGLERLEVLPGDANPLLIFLGAGTKGGNAVFLVDSTLTAAGEGRCKPSKAECAFLYLGAGSEHEFTSEEGDSYTLRVDQIRKVKVGAPADEDSTGADSANTAKASFEGETATRRFVPPLIADLVTLTSGTDELSDDGPSGR